MDSIKIIIYRHSFFLFYYYYFRFSVVSFVLLAHIKVGERGFENIYDLLIFCYISGIDNHDLNFPCLFFHIVGYCGYGFAFYSQLEERTRWREYRKTIKSLGIWENRSFSRTTVLKQCVSFTSFSDRTVLVNVFYFIHGFLENWLLW